MWFLFIVPCCPFVNCTQKVNKKERFDLAKKSRASSAERKRAALCSSALSMNISTLRAAFFNDPTQPRGVFFLPRGRGWALAFFAREGCWGCVLLFHLARNQLEPTPRALLCLGVLGFRAFI